MDTDRLHHFKNIHRLKPKRKQQEKKKEDTANPFRKTQFEVNQLLSSISPKLKPRSISISTDSRLSTVFVEREQTQVFCIDGFSIPNFIPSHQYISLNFEELKRLAMRKGLKKITKAGCMHSNTKKICFHSACPIKQSWVKRMVRDEKELRKAQELKKMSETKPNKHWQQIEKDLYRSLPQHLIPKTKLTLFHVNSQKTSIFEGLRSVLRMYTIEDEQLGYVQGMNLVAGIIVSHVKEVQKSYIIFSYIMKHGLRAFYLDNFRLLREQCNFLLHHYVKELMRDLYDHLDSGDVQTEFFMAFYLSLCCNIADYDEVHNVIDLFLNKGITFLHQLIISLLCFLKDKLLSLDPFQAICALGASNLKEAVVSWDEVINLSQGIQLH